MKILKIGAVWCNACLVMKPRWQEVESELAWLKTEYYDFDENEKKITKYKIAEGKLPVFIFLDKQGEEFLRLTGEISKNELIKIIQKNKNR